MLGDYNYPNINWEYCNTPKVNESPEYKFLQCLRDKSLVQHVMSPTRGRLGNTANILDLLITNELGMVKEIVHSARVITLC